MSAGNQFDFASYTLRIYQDAGEERERIRAAIKGYFEPFLNKAGRESCRIWMNVQNQRLDLQLRRPHGFNLTPTNRVMLAAMEYFTFRQDQLCEQLEQERAAAVAEQPVQARQNAGTY
jgi:hypothetical protein